MSETLGHTCQPPGLDIVSHLHPNSDIVSDTDPDMVPYVPGPIFRPLFNGNTLGEI